MKNKAALFWSGGKDSAFALYRILEEKKYSVEYLVSTINKESGRITMHGVREGLIMAQSFSVNIPLLPMYIHTDSTNKSYEESFRLIAEQLKEEGVTHFIFGDLFLEDIRNYRETLLKPFGIEAVFPIWGYNSFELAAELLRNKFSAMICCADKSLFKEDITGRFYDEVFIGNIPKNVDVCGENGEFHTFVLDAPFFKESLNVVCGDRIIGRYEGRGEVKEFWFCDLLLKKNSVKK